MRFCISNWLVPTTDQFTEIIKYQWELILQGYKCLTCSLCKIILRFKTWTFGWKKYWNILNINRVNSRNWYNPLKLMLYVLFHTTADEQDANFSRINLHWQLIHLRKNKFYSRLIHLIHSRIAGQYTHLTELINCRILCLNTISDTCNAATLKNKVDFSGFISNSI